MILAIGRRPAPRIASSFTARHTAYPHSSRARLVALRGGQIVMRPQSTGTDHSKKPASPSPRSLRVAAAIGAASVALYWYDLVQQCEKEEALTAVRNYLKDNAGAMKTDKYQAFLPWSLDVATSLEAMSQLNDIRCGELHTLLSSTLATIYATLGKSLEQRSYHAAENVATFSRCFRETDSLARKIGDDAFQAYKQVYPTIGGALGAHYLELRSLAARGGDDAQHLAQKTLEEVHQILSGAAAGYTPDSAVEVSPPFKVDPGSVARADSLLLRSIGQLRVTLSEPIVNELLGLLSSDNSATPRATKETLFKVRDLIPRLRPWEARELLDTMQANTNRMKLINTLNSLLRATIAAEAGVRTQVDELVDKEPGTEEVFHIVSAIQDLAREACKHRADAEKLAKELKVQMPEPDPLLPHLADREETAKGDAS